MLTSSPPVLTFLSFKIIEKYLKATSNGYYKPKIVNVWEVDRETEVGAGISFVKCNADNLSSVS